MENNEAAAARLNRYKNLVIQLVVFVVFLILSIQGIKGTWDSISAENDTISQLEERLGSLTQKEAILRSVSTQGSFLEQQGKLKEAIPSLIDLPLILATLQKIGDETHVVLGEFSIAPNAAVVSLVSLGEDNRLTSFQFQVNLTGSFDDLQAFINRLGSVSPMLRITTITFTRDNSKATINFYFEPEKTAKQDIAAPLKNL